MARHYTLKEVEYFEYSKKADYVDPPEAYKFSKVDLGGVLGEKVSAINTRGEECTFYVDWSCEAKGGSFKFKGAVANMLDVPELAIFDNRITSFNCGERIFSRVSGWELEYGCLL
ncbi:hypothetical protein LZ554_004518 [Drepanopeziza brunnea f. sp. 'monogermtubi']|nr:hypothetical protein LZ554_004518 [Drepanopeziza brunnea f. sp. 'monogermtubi']